MASTHTAVPTATSKHTILTIPTEMTERIASFLEPKDLLNLRRSNYEIATRSFKGFVDQFVKGTSIRFGRVRNNAEITMAGIKSNLHLAQRIQSLTVGGYLHELCLSILTEVSMPTLERLQIDNSNGTKSCCLESLL